MRPLVQDKNFINSLSQADRALFYTFYSNGEEVGYCLIEQPINTNVEVSDFGFFPEYLSQGFGKIFFPQILNICFTRHKDVENVILSTRSTNHSKVPDFYKSFGFVVNSCEDIDDVLLPPDRIFIKKLYE